MWVNSCHAILKSSTIDNAVKFFRKNQFKSMTAVIKKNTWFYDKYGKPINVKNPKDQVMSQKSNHVYEVCHLENFISLVKNIYLKKIHIGIIIKMILICTK